MVRVVVLACCLLPLTTRHMGAQFEQSCLMAMISSILGLSERVHREESDAATRGSRANSLRLTHHDFEASHPVISLIITLAISLAVQDKLIEISSPLPMTTCLSII